MGIIMIIGVNYLMSSSKYVVYGCDRIVVGFKTTQTRGLTDQFIITTLVFLLTRGLTDQFIITTLVFLPLASLTTYAISA
jgi:hypothetical protein